MEQFIYLFILVRPYEQPVDALLCDPCDEANYWQVQFTLPAITMHSYIAIILVGVIPVCFIDVMFLFYRISLNTAVLTNCHTSFGPSHVIKL